jgi:hypothetical protein
MTGSFFTVSLSFWADLGSLVGLAATLWTAWSAYRSKRYYLLVGRVSEQIEKLQASTSALIEHNDPSADRKDRLRALKGIRVALESIARHVGRQHRDEFRALEAKIQKIEQEEFLDSDELDEIWAEAEVLATKADALVRDAKFTRGS